MSTFGAVNSLKRAAAARAGRAARVAPVAIALILAAAPAMAALYKWVDASGTVVYSDQPPPAGIKSELVTTPVAPPSNPNAVQDMANKDLEQKKRLAQQAQDEKAAEKARVDDNRKREACQQMLLNLRMLQSPDPIYQMNESGQRVEMDAVAKQRERDLLQKQIRDNCTS